MKKLILTSISTVMAMTLMAQNPLLQQWATPHETPPFSQITLDDFTQAIPQQLEEARGEYALISANPDKATFENTIEAMEYSGEGLSRTLSIFYNLLSANTSDELQQLAMELSASLTAFSNDINLDPQLFERIRLIYDSRSEREYTVEQLRLLEKVYQGFLNSGATLRGEDRDTYRKITEELSTLALKFNENQLAATNSFSIHLEDSTQLSGVPAWAISGFAQAAKDEGKEGYLLTLHSPSYVPIMTYADNRELRHKLWLAYNSRAYGGEYDNSQIVIRIANLRLELAQLLGFQTYGEYALEDRMAASVTEVMDLLDQLSSRSLDAAKGEVEMVAQYAREQGFEEQMKQWDLGYWSEKLKQERYTLTDDMTRPYFELRRCEEAIFLLANTLYGLEFREAPQIEGYHTDTKAFEVFDTDGSFLSVLYIDYYPRASKGSGAWMSNYRDMRVDRSGKEIRPIVSLVCNFTKPSEDHPSLLSFDEFTTLLHEFGHGLHGILAKGNYSSLTGTSVYQDFVELPSQLMENFAYQKEFLDMFAVHYQTAEKIPQELISRVIEAKNYMAAYQNIRQVTFATTDMAWHSITEPITQDARTFELRASERMNLFTPIEGVCMAPAFGHIFSGGYAAGYYSYKWAEVLEADAFEHFKSQGIFNPQTAQKFRTLLEAGGTVHPMTLYKEFAGTEPTIEPLIKKMGL